MAPHIESIAVRYAETDKMGVAHHSSYLLWFELGRTGLLRAAGFSYRDLEAGGAMLPVLEYGARFYRGASYDDVLSIETTVTVIRSRTISFAYRVLRGTEVIADGFTRHVCVDADNRPRRFPDGVVEAVAAYRPDAA
jgi:acyl-CoA thioester hydrolase